MIGPSYGSRVMDLYYPWSRSSTVLVIQVMKRGRNVWQRTYKCNVSGYIWLSLHIAQRNFIFLSLLGTIYSLIFNHFSLLSLCILSLLIHAIFLSIKTRISLLKISITKIKDSLLEIDLIMHQRDEKYILIYPKEEKKRYREEGKILPTWLHDSPSSIIAIVKKNVTSFKIVLKIVSSSRTRNHSRKNKCMDD